MRYKCLTIAGFDSSGGAGIQADLKTFSALGCYGMSVLTALPVQNTQGVKSCFEISIDAIRAQLETIFEDIVPDSIKIGMLFSKDIILCVYEFLKAHARNIPVIVDPVMLAKSGDALLLPEAITALKTHIIPHATLITPNLPEAYTLVGQQNNKRLLAEKVLALGAETVLIKGGHDRGAQANDLYLDKQNNCLNLSMPSIDTKNTHGTGCTLSAAICAFTGRGYPLPIACKKAKVYLYEAIKAAQYQSVGKGQGPVHHFYQWW